MLNLTYININAGDGEDKCGLGLAGNVAVELLLSEVPAYRVERRLRRNGRKMR